MKIITLSLITLLIVTSGCAFFKYDHATRPLSIQEHNSVLLQNKIDSILSSEHDSNYLPYSFSEMITEKPEPFLALDSVYELKRRLKVKNDNYGVLNTIYNTEIDSLKRKINRKKIYHTYSIDHIYLIKNTTFYNLLEENYTFFPNFTLKQKTINLSTNLTLEEKDLFDYYTFRNPLFETPDYSYNAEMDQLVYNRFNSALTIEKEKKSKLIHTILYCIKYIRQYNDFNEQKIAEGIAEKWIITHNLDDFKPNFNTLTPVKEENQISSYLLSAKNKKGEETIIFTFDLNLVIINTNLN